MRSVFPEPGGNQRSITEHRRCCAKVSEENDLVFRTAEEDFHL